MSITNVAGESDQKSRDLLEAARLSLNTVQANLSPDLANATADVDQIKAVNLLSDRGNTQINLALDNLKLDSQKDIYSDALVKAIEAQEQAAEVKRILRPIGQSLPNDLERSRQMPKKVEDTNLDINQASDQVDRVAAILPNIQSFVNDLRQRQDRTAKVGSDLGDRIEQLKKQIEIARDIANSIKVGVRFYPNTTLELPPPANLPLLASDSRISAYVRTSEPHGFLLYLGNDDKPDGKRSKYNDFLALEIQNGYPILNIDLGNGPEKIISNKNIANGKWHQIIVERSGNDVKLTVREQLENGQEHLHETEVPLHDGNGIFDLNRENTKLYVGGYPPDFNNQDRVQDSSFVGEIEDLRIGDQEVGLWNFIDGQNNNHGARERDILITSETPPTGYRFSGHGYVILDSTTYPFKARSNIQFKFKTGRDTTDGLMFYAGKHKHFISVEMRNGGVYFQYQLGEHRVQIGTDKQLNDDRWHRVQAERDGRVGILKIDDKVIYQEEAPVGADENLKISDQMYFGGHPNTINHTGVITKNFDGCIDEVFIANTPVDLSQNLKAYGVRPGCSNKFSNILSFPPRQFGYLRKDNVTADNYFQINLKFRTKQDKGIIFYAADPKQDNRIGLTLEDGALVLRSQNVEVSTHPTKYNDSEWHFLTATHDANKLRLSVDDTTEVESAENTNPLYLNDAQIYFGGLPKGTKVPRGALNSPAYFTGCISDVFLNGPIVNFAESVDRESAVLNNCARDILGECS